LLRECCKSSMVEVECFRIDGRAIGIVVRLGKRIEHGPDDRSNHSQVDKLRASSICCLEIQSQRNAFQKLRRSHYLVPTTLQPPSRNVERRKTEVRTFLERTKLKRRRGGEEVRTKRKELMVHNVLRPSCQYVKQA
jgi:hypothetical protein